MSKANKTWLKILGIDFLLLVIIAFAMLRGKGGSSYMDITNKILTENKGHFRYAFSVDTSKHSISGASGAEKDKKTTEEEVIAVADVDKILEKYRSQGNDFVNWEDKDGVADSKWVYPKYDLAFEGNVKSVDPLEMNVVINLSTFAFNDVLTEIVVKDNKTYVDISKLRYWLLSSKSSRLVNLGVSIPDSCNYVEFEGDAFNLYSTFAEDGEIDSSRESNLIRFYNRIVSNVSTFINQLNIDSSCFKKSDKLYKLNISGDNSIKVLTAFKGIVNNAKDLHNRVIENQFKQKLLSDTQFEQAKCETDNLIAALSDLSEYLEVADFKNLNLKVSGDASEFSGAKGKTMESSVSIAFVADKVDYNIDIKLSRRATLDDFDIPSKSVSKISQLNVLDKDNFISDCFVIISDYLNISGIDTVKKISPTIENIKNDTVKAFIDLVNKRNKGVSGFNPLNVDTVAGFINKYRLMNITDATSDLEKTNKELVGNLLEEFEKFIPSEAEVDTSDISAQSNANFKVISFKNNDYSLYASIDKDISEDGLIKVDYSIFNKSSDDLEFNAQDFTLKTAQGTKFVANQESDLEAYSNVVDTESLVTNIPIVAGKCVEGSLYFVLSDNLDGIELCHDDTNLGVLIE